MDDRRLVVVRQKTGDRQVIPYASIREINLRQDMAGVYVAMVRHADGTLAIPARHFVGFGRFETRAREYAELLGVLHAAVRKANPTTRFVAGSSALFYAGVLVLVLASALAILVVVAVLMRGRMPPLQGSFPILLGIGVGVGFVAQGRAKEYEPGALPEKFLPRA